MGDAETDATDVEEEVAFAEVAGVVDVDIGADTDGMAMDVTVAKEDEELNAVINQETAATEAPPAEVVVLPDDDENVGGTDMDGNLGDAVSVTSTNIHEFIADDQDGSTGEVRGLDEDLKDYVEVPSDVPQDSEPAQPDFTDALGEDETLVEDATIASTAPADSVYDDQEAVAQVDAAFRVYDEYDTLATTAAVTTDVTRDATPETMVSQEDAAGEATQSESSYAVESQKSRRSEAVEVEDSYFGVTGAGESQMSQNEALFEVEESQTSQSEAGFTQVSGLLTEPQLLTAY